MHITKLRDDVHVLVGDCYGANSTLFLDGDEALLVDGMGSRADASQLKRYVEETLGAQVRFLIMTHYFSDHMAALALFPRAQIVAHENAVHTFAFERHRSAEEEAHFVAPTITFSGPLTMRWGRYSLELFPNPGHTMSTIAIDVPELDVLFTGDTLVGNIVYLAYGAPEMLDRALRQLRMRGRTSVIASHDAVRDAASIGHATHYLARLREASLAAFESDESRIAAISIEECLPAGVAPTDFERVFHGRNLEAIREQRLFIATAKRG
ncbi:MAG TPA: MBL fold metallo-hydrolase [Thermoanaerobaculia bacterium]|nr:MBL fold metallo-hydrolase [Thermoanaerobaculia bacterium]